MSEAENLTDWAAVLVAEKRQAERKAELAERKVLSDRRMIARAMPRLWASLVKEVESRVATLRDAMGNGLRIKAAHDARRKRLALVATKSGREIFVFQLQPDCYGLVTTHRRYRLCVEGVSDVLWEGDDRTGRVGSETLAVVAVEVAFREA